VRDLGVAPGSVLVVHTAFSRVAPVEGGPAGLILALTDVLGPSGTLVMPSMTDDDDHPFDPAKTPCRHLGVVADTFWRQLGVLRGDTPHAFAALGPRAAAIVAPQPLDVPHGPDSPVGRVHDLDGWILLLGVNHDANTTVHLAEALAGVRYRIPHYVTVLRDSAPVRVDYQEIDHCCRRFALVDDWLDQARAQRRGVVGHAEARLVRSRAVVEAVTARLREHETVFLHELGVDAECDAARASLIAPGRPGPQVQPSPHAPEM
jgi:aminoglycoside N3'-acetyltransferase